MKKLLLIFLALFSVNTLAAEYKDEFEKPQYAPEIVIKKFKPKTQKILKKIFKDNEVSEKQLADLVNTEVGRIVLILDKDGDLEQTGELFHTLTETEQKHLKPIIKDLDNSFMKVKVKNRAKIVGVQFLLRL